jgi:outer membrane protein assembly factor BamE (lipoprotein component of BamABCDE complex)
MVLAIIMSAGLAGCNVLGDFSSVKTQGYQFDQSALAQIRPGQSQALVQTVLGSPMTTNDFGSETAWYYVQTKVSQTAFGLTNVMGRTVLAVYFDKNKRVTDRAVYTLKDGKSFAIETRHTPSYGEDRTFIDSILKSI